MSPIRQCRELTPRVELAMTELAAEIGGMFDVTGTPKSGYWLLICDDVIFMFERSKFKVIQILGDSDKC